MRIGLSGIGGYGQIYLRWFFEGELSHLPLSAVADPSPEKSIYYQKLSEGGPPLYSTCSKMLEKENLDLLIVSSPIQFHVPQSIEAINFGCHVLCEKPLSGSLKDALELQKAAEKSKKVVAIGYQWSFSEAILKLKRDLMEGRWGKPLFFKTKVCWPRPLTYYSRNNWAGKIRDSDGRPVFDSPLNNAGSHFLHNMFFLLGKGLDQSASPAVIEAECYRANNIQNYDTVFCRIAADTGCRLLFIATHAVLAASGPEFELQCQGGTLSFPAENGLIVGRKKDGEVVQYGTPGKAPHAKVNATLKAIAGEEPLPCTVQTALSQLVTMEAIQQKGNGVTAIPKKLILDSVINGETFLSIKGLEAVADICYLEGKLPSEQGLTWAHKFSTITL